MFKRFFHPVLVTAGTLSLWTLCFLMVAVGCKPCHTTATNGTCGLQCGFCGDCCSSDCPGCLMDEVISPNVGVGDIKGPWGAGTVILVKGEKLVLTAGHCVVDLWGSKQDLWIYQENESQTCYTKQVGIILVYKLDMEVDLALVRPTDSRGMKAARYTGQATLARGQDCWYVGTPGGLCYSLEKSIINRPNYLCYEERVPRVIFNGNIWYGNSGGGLYVLDKGQYTLVGVVVELTRRGEKAPGAAITQGAINQFLTDFTKGK